MPHFIRSQITIMLPLADGRSPREITERTNELDRAVHYLTEALHADNVTVSEPEIALVRAKGEPEPAATTLDLAEASSLPASQNAGAVLQANGELSKSAPPPPDDDSGFDIPPSLRRGK